MSRKAAVIQKIRVSGFHNDSVGFTSLYIKSRLSFEIASKAFREGKALKEKGHACNCFDCFKKAKNENA